MAANPPLECFALLDDAQATSSDPRSRLYSEYLTTLICSDFSDLPQFFTALQQELKQGRFIVTLLSYELGAALHHIEPRTDCLFPAAQALVFNHCQKLSSEQVGQWLQEVLTRDSTLAGIGNLHHLTDEQSFNAALTQIHQYIEHGDTYQVNYTFPLHFDTFGTPTALYHRLRSRQKVPYGALITLPNHQAILSLSPELFLKHVDGELTAQPMKGTLHATHASQECVLAQDPKNQAENVMIVDLLRNDLGQIAQIGSVRVPQLFEVQQYGEVLQMTSTITAQLRPEILLDELFRALYPCGSITGAPKHRTMQIIRECEPHARGLYTGAIGWFDPPQVTSSIGNFCLSVPIRTLVLTSPNNDEIREGVLNIGAGITYDSDAKKEHAECLLKAQFLTQLPQEFQLFETLRLTPGGYPYLEQHLQRLKKSAHYFRFHYDEPSIRQRLQVIYAQQPKGTYRLRLTLHESGTYETDCAPLIPIQKPAQLLLAPNPVNTPPLFLRHKTTIRTAYDDAWHQAEAQGAFDMIFTNAHGALTEGARSNIFLQLDGRWHTPPLDVGILPGIMRAQLLRSPLWNALERPLTVTDLFQAKQIVVCNALRGILPVTISA